MDNEFIVTRDELKKMFREKQMIDTGKGWQYKGKRVDIAAIHTIEPKYLLDIARAENYRIIYK